MSEVASPVQQALDLAKEAKAEIAAHEDVCAIRYGNIDDKLNMLFKIIAWAGGTAFFIVMGLLAFLAKTQFEQITALQQAVQTRQITPASPPQVYIQPAPGSPAMGATVDKRTPTP